MLGFFRKYQKFFFVFVTFFIVISFVFFGTSNQFGLREEVPNREIGKLIDGSPLMEKELHSLLKVLEHGLEEGGRSFNLLNDSMVHREILVSGMGEGIAEHYFEDIKEELSERWNRIKHYTPYQHPFAPYIGARQVWAQYAPEINQLLQEVKEASSEFSKEHFLLLFKLYQAQAKFPAYFLHQIIYSQQMQNQGVRPDPSLPQLNVALFGFESIEDWFGPKFVERIGIFLMNAACIAHEEGYRVSSEEAHLDLLSNVYRGLKMIGKTQLDEETIHTATVNQVHALGLHFEEAVAVWRSVMQFKRHFQEVGEAVFLDRLAFDQFKRFAKASHKICRYSLPKGIELQDFRDVMKFQHYIEVTGEGKFDDLPEQFKDAEKVMEEHPELVYKSFSVEIARVSKHDVAARVGLKHTWKWEVDHFSSLQDQFSGLKNTPCLTEEDRYRALDQLSELERLRVDQFARNRIVEENPHLIDEALAHAEREQETLKVTVLDGEFSGKAFLDLLEAGGSANYTEDGQIFSAIRVIEKGGSWQLLSFAEANRRGILDQMLEHLLACAYETMEIEEPFDELTIGKIVFADLLEGFQGEDLNTIASHRFDAFLSSMRQVAQEDLAKVTEGPWALEISEEYYANEGMELSTGEFSEVTNHSFFRLIETEDPCASDEDIAAAKEHLKKDAQQALMRKIISRL